MAKVIQCQWDAHLATPPGEVTYSSEENPPKSLKQVELWASGKYDCTDKVP